MNNEIHFNQNLKRIRSINKHTQQEAASKVGISRAALSSYEEKRALPPIDVAIRICHAYAVTLDELFLIDLTNDKRVFGKPSIDIDVTKFEYCIKHRNAFENSQSDLQDAFLSRMGEKGWELCSVSTQPLRDGSGIATWDYYFKRVILPK